MIISPDELKENNFYQICSKLDELYEKQFNTEGNQGRRRPKKYTDLQIIKCFLFKVKNKIYCLRELETKLDQNPFIKNIIGIDKAPDHSTLSIRVKKIRKNKFYPLFRQLVSKLEPDTRINAIDSTPLRSSKCDSEAKKGYSTRLEWYKGYKLHLVSSNDYIPLSFSVTTANIYDNTYDICKNLMIDLSQYNPFMLLGDAGYDSTKLFELAHEEEFNLLTDINLKNADSPEDFTDQCRRENARYFNSPLGEKMYENRTTIERLFSFLKERYNLEAPRLYGYQRYSSHVRWVLLLYLLEKLLDKKQGINDNKFPWNR